MKYTLSFFGAGNMGSAILHSLLEKNIIPHQNLRICDRDLQKLTPFQTQSIRVTQNADEICDADVLFFALKPQVAEDFFQSIRPQIGKNSVLVSIAAGLSADFLSQISGLKKIIRVMPNTPAMVQRGVSGVYFSSPVLESERGLVRTLLESFGSVIMCETEEKIDAITALSGSGPAYYFRILEIMTHKARDMGFSSHDARIIALGTLQGAGALAEESGEDVSLLRQNVTSKGGTTAVALESFAKNGLQKILTMGIDAAFARAVELSEGVKRES